MFSFQGRGRMVSSLGMLSHFGASSVTESGGVSTSRRLVSRFIGQAWDSQNSRSSLCARARMDIPDFLPLTWSNTRRNKPLGPSLALTPEDAIVCQLDALKHNDHPFPDHGVEVMYRFAGFDPFQRSNYFGRSLDLGQFERFRRIFHHSTYRILLGHSERISLSKLQVTEHLHKQRLLVTGPRPDEEGIFEFSLVQRVGGCWDGFWFTESLHCEGEGIDAIAY